MHTHPCWERLSPEEQQRVCEQHGAFRRELRQKGAFVASYDFEEASESERSIATREEASR